MPFSPLTRETTIRADMVYKLTDNADTNNYYYDSISDIRNANCEEYAELKSSKWNLFLLEHDYNHQTFPCKIYELNPNWILSSTNR